MDTLQHPLQTPQKSNFNGPEETKALNHPKPLNPKP